MRALLVLALLFASSSVSAASPYACKGHGTPTVVSSVAQATTALNHASAGDTIVFAPGNYTQSLVVNKGGSAAAPIYIAAAHPAVNTDAAFQSVPQSNFKHIHVQASNVVICGFSFGNNTNLLVEPVSGAIRNVYVQQNYFNGNAMIHLKFGPGGDNMGVYNNLFKKSLTSTEGDYGIAIFQTTEVNIAGNIFEGSWNHAISMKDKASAVIRSNNFKACGRTCVELGQGLDWIRPGKTNPEELTSFNAVVRSNIFTAGGSLRGHSGDRRGIFVKNIKYAEISDNRFGGGFDFPIHVNAVPNMGGDNIGNGAKLLLKEPNHPEYLLIENNKFTGGKIILNGRGRGEAERVRIQSNTGQPVCESGKYNTMGIPDSQFIWSTINKAKSTVIQNGNGFTCS